MFCNRRQILAVSSLSLSSLMIGSPLALASDDAELKVLIKDVIQRNYPRADEHKAMVDQFIKDLLQQKLENLEPAGFLRQEFRKTDRSALERYVLVQFMTSPGFIEVQDK